MLYITFFCNTILKIITCYLYSQKIMIRIFLKSTVCLVCDKLFSLYFLRDSRHMGIPKHKGNVQFLFLFFYFFQSSLPFLEPSFPPNLLSVLDPLCPSSPLKPPVEMQPICLHLMPELASLQLPLELAHVIALQTTAASSIFSSAVGNRPHYG